MSIEDLKRLIGTDLGDEELLDTLAMYGVPPDEVREDTLFLEVFPNRPDMLSVEGVARAIRGVVGKETGYKLYVPKPAVVGLSIDASVKNIRPYCSAAVVREANLDTYSVASLMQLQEKLHGTHGRKRKKVSIGVMDLDKCKPPIIFSAIPKDQIRFTPLGASGELTADQILNSTEKGRTYKSLLEDLPLYPLIYDSDGTVLSMPPIINSEDTKVDENTRNLFIEAEGWDQQAVEQAVFIISTSLAERGAKLEQVKITDENGTRLSPSFAPRSLELNVDYCNQTIGSQFSPREIKTLLEKMRYEALAGERGVKVAVPPYRTDIMHPIDLVEDVAIASGYGNFEPRIETSQTVGKLHDSTVKEDIARTIMVGCGFEEVFTYALTNEKKLFDLMNSKPRDTVTIENPKSTEFTIVRDMVLPSLLKVLSDNTHNPYPQRIFEVSPQTVLDSSETGAGEKPAVAAVFADKRANFSQAKGIVGAVCRLLGLEVRLEQSALPFYTPGRQARMVSEGRTIGFFGEISPEVLVANSIEMPCAGFEMTL